MIRNSTSSVTPAEAEQIQTDLGLCRLAHGFSRTPCVRTGATCATDSSVRVSNSLSRQSPTPLSAKAGSDGGEVALGKRPLLSRGWCPVMAVDRRAHEVRSRWRLVLPLRPRLCARRRSRRWRPAPRPTVDRSPLPRNRRAAERTRVIVHGTREEISALAQRPRRVGRAMAGGRRGPARRRPPGLRRSPQMAPSISCRATRKCVRRCRSSIKSTGADLTWAGIGRAARHRRHSGRHRAGHWRCGHRFRHHGPHRAEGQGRRERQHGGRRSVDR